METQGFRHMGPVASDIPRSHGCGPDHPFLCFCKGIRLRAFIETVLKQRGDDSGATQDIAKLCHAICRLHELIEEHLRKIRM